MADLNEEYGRLLDKQNFGVLDYSILDKHIETLTRFCAITNSAITVFDNSRRKTVFESEGYQNLFSGEHDAIHPDDQEGVLRSGVIALRYFFDGNKNAVNHRLVRKYRAKIKGEYRVVAEQMQALEFDSKGNVWLSVDLVDISPNQSPPYNVEFKIFNIRTGDVIVPVDEFIDGKPILSEREVDVLKLIDEGLLSKEISEKLYISVHTVNTHRQRILEKLKVGTSIEAIKYARALGLWER